MAFSYRRESEYGVRFAQKLYKSKKRKDLKDLDKFVRFLAAGD